MRGADNPAADRFVRDFFGESPELLDVTSVQDTFARRVPNYAEEFRGSVGGLRLCKRYRVTLEGTLNNRGAFVVDGGGTLHPDTVQTLTRRFERLPDPAPTWRPGDVVVVWFSDDEDAKRYTYVRGEYTWPGERGSKNDAFFDQLWERERVTPVLQAGGEPFDEDRLA